MSIRELVSRRVQTVERDATVRSAAMRMAEHHVGTLVVVDGGAPVGMLTDRDIVTRCVAREHDPATTPVSEVMSRPVHTVSEDMSLTAAVETMAEKEIRRLVVTDRGRMVGILALDDVLGRLVREADDLGHLLKVQAPV